jgi:hypothetical protein
MSYRFYRDDDGDLRAQTGRGLRLLGRFLEADIQDSILMCDEVLAALDDVVAGRARRRQLTGNAHTLTAFKHKSRIRSEFGRSADLALPTCKLRRALLEWRALLENASRRRPGK